MVQRGVCPGPVQCIDSDGTGKGKRDTSDCTDAVPLEESNPMFDDGEGDLYGKEISAYGLFEGEIRTLMCFKNNCKENYDRE